MSVHSQVVLALLACASVPTAMAQATPAGTPPSVVLVQPATAAASGLTAFKDPVTGALRPPEHGEVEALRALVPPARAPSPPVQVQLANGSFMVRLDASFDSYAVATRGADGLIAFDCLTPQEVAAARKHAHTPAPRQAETRFPARPEMPDVQ